MPSEKSVMAECSLHKFAWRGPVIESWLRIISFCLVSWTVCGIQLQRFLNFAFSWTLFVLRLGCLLCRHLHVNFVVGGSWWWCFTALGHVSGLFRCGQLTYPHCFWANLLSSLPVLSAHSFASNWQLSFLSQRKGENVCGNYFMTSLHERMLLDVRIKPATVRIPGGRACDRAIAPG